MCTLLLVWSEHWVFFYSCGVMVFFFSLNIFFLLVGFSFFRFICRRCFVCIYLFITLVSKLFILGVLGPWGFLWRAGSYFPSAWDSAVWSAWSGTIYLSAGLEWVAGLYGFFFSWALLRWVRYDWNSGGVWSLFSLPSSVCCLLCRQAVVCGRAPFSS